MAAGWEDCEERWQRAGAGGEGGEGGRDGGGVREERGGRRRLRDLDDGSHCPASSTQTTGRSVDPPPPTAENGTMMEESSGTGPGRGWVGG